MVRTSAHSPNWTLFANFQLYMSGLREYNVYAWNDKSYFRTWRFICAEKQEMIYIFNSLIVSD